MAYNLLPTVHVMTAGDMTGDLTTTPIECKLQDNVGYQLHWTGTPVGTFSFQVSMDYAVDIYGNVTNVGHWITLPVTPAITAAGTPDDAYVDLNQLSATFTRMVYTAGSSTGSLDVYTVAKGI